LWYFEPESKNVIYTAITGGGLVATTAYRKEDLSKDEYTGALTITPPNGVKASAVEHTKWNGKDEFSVWRTDFTVNGEKSKDVKPERGLGTEKSEK
jgi:hypothetical protein